MTVVQIPEARNSLQEVDIVGSCISDFDRRIPQRSTDNRERISSIMTPIQEQRLEVVMTMTNQKDNNGGGIVACEPSVGDEDDNDEIIDFHHGTLEDNNDRRCDLATPIPTPGHTPGPTPNKAQDQDQADTSIFGTLPNNIEEKDNGSLNSTKPHDQNQQSVTQFSHEIEHEIRQGDYLGNKYSPKAEEINEAVKVTQEVANQGRQEVLDTSCNIHFQTGDEDEKRVGNIEDMKQKAVDSYRMTEKVGVAKRQSQFSRKFVMMKLQEKKFPTPKKEFDNHTCAVIEMRIL